jgi:hypothetical protein
VNRGELPAVDRSALRHTEMVPQREPVGKKTFSTRGSCRACGNAIILAVR